MLSCLVSKFPRVMVPNVRRAISVQSILHGSQEAKEAGDEEVQHHSRLIARGKYLHGIEIHRVKPDSVKGYKKAAERYFTGLRDDPELRIKLSGNFEAIVGEQDTFYHVLEYENHSGVDNAWKRDPGSEHEKARDALLPFLRSRVCFLADFSPHEEGGIFELRAYQLNPGALLEWEATWRRGIEARKKLVQPVGAWYAQVGRLHQVYHLWQYPNLETRKEMRENAWQVDGWADTVHKTSQLARSMDSIILTPLPFSPLK
ncbi:NIPSNAP-domain-containing protein [Multifurca ochricompacta]|uniref:NIPSNAP-domain-containing protein n=1 Tax=Multifurca ochricompacta TaxID=376703 RepID=A0AAD4QQS0_9AGAM|nr:NIPSNAP-domain-containing protein [Multifurca ochricompacta]